MHTTVELIYKITYTHIHKNTCIPHSKSYIKLHVHMHKITCIPQSDSDRGKSKHNMNKPRIEGAQREDKVTQYTNPVDLLTNKKVNIYIYIVDRHTYLHMHIACLCTYMDQDNVTQ
jgi:hypothetical protein